MDLNWISAFFGLENVFECFVVNEEFFWCIESEITNVAVLTFTVLLPNAVSVSKH